MTKLVASSIVAVIIGYIGLSARRIYRLRRNILEDYLSFLNGLLEEISFYKSPIVEYISRIKGMYSKHFVEILDEYESSILENKSFVMHSKYVKADNIKIIQNCFNNIGRCDANTEMINLQNYISEANIMVKVANEELKNKGELYAKLSILLGIAVMIMMI